MQSIQERVDFISSVLADISGVKMMGVTRSLMDVAQGHRLTEIDMSKSFRWLITWMNLFCQYIIA